MDDQERIVRLTACLHEQDKQIKSLKRKLKLRDTKIRKLNHEVRSLEANLRDFRRIGYLAIDLYEEVRYSGQFNTDD